ATAAEPVQAGSHGDGARVAMIAQAGANLFHSAANICRVGNTAARKIDLIDVEGPAIDERAERFTPAFSFARGDRQGRAIPQPDVAVDIVLAERLFEPVGAVLRKCLGTPQRCAGVPYTAGVDEERV